METSDLHGIFFVNYELVTLTDGMIPDVEIQIQDGGGGHIEFQENATTQSNIGQK